MTKFIEIMTSSNLLWTVILRLKDWRMESHDTQRSQTCVREGMLYWADSPILLNLGQGTDVDDGMDVVGESHESSRPEMGEVCGAIDRAVGERVTSQISKVVNRVDVLDPLNHRIDPVIPRLIEKSDGGRRLGLLEHVEMVVFLIDYQSFLPLGIRW